MNLDFKGKPFTGLRIGYDAKRIYQNYTGLGNYCRTLVSSIYELHWNEVWPVLYAPKVVHNNRTKDFDDRGVITPKNKLDKIGWRSYGMSKLINNSKIDVFHGLSAELPYGLKVPSVVTIHDLIFETHPRQYSFFDRKLYSAKAKFACKTAKKVVAISEATKQDIMKFYGTPEQKIEVIYQTCEDQFFEPVSEGKITEVKEKYNLPKDYLLYVGSVIERKKLFDIVKAVEQLGENSPPLVAIGNTSSKYGQQVVNYVEENSLEQKVIFLSPDFSDFPAIYKAAIIFLYPSEYEGFGIPIIEAQAVGTPVITSAFSCLPEAAGQHSVLLNELSPTAIAEAVTDLLNHPEKRQSMSIAGLDYVKRFAKEKVTKQMVTLYQSLV